VGLKLACRALGSLRPNNARAGCGPSIWAGTEKLNVRMRPGKSAELKILGKVLSKGKTK
jgi:hypothetical protein